MNNIDKRFIESEEFLKILPKINKKSTEEKTFHKPLHWKMIYWPTRKPLVVARAFIFSALLPENYDLNMFEKDIGLYNSEYKLDTHSTPDKFKNIVLLDPFAGFGSIPLEAIRLGIGKVISSDLLPMATFLEKTILYFPRIFGEDLLKDVRKYGNELLKKLEPISKELYDDYQGFVGSWEIKCPMMNYYSPLLYHFWLLKLPDSSRTINKSDFSVYRRLAFMEYEVTNEKTIRIVPRDLNKELGLKKIKAIIYDDVIKTDDKQYKIPRGNITPKQHLAKCLQDNYLINGNSEEDWYVKKALIKWNKNYEDYLSDRISLDELANSPARPRILIGFKGKSVRYLDFYETTTYEEKFWSSFQKIINLKFLPKEEVWKYNRIFTWGFDKYFKAYNPRQLLIAESIVSLIKGIYNDIANLNGKEYATAIVSYLTLSFLNYLRYNSMLTLVDPSRKFISQALSWNRPSMIWNWVEISPLSDLPGSLKKSLEALYKGLEYIIRILSGTESEVRIMTSDVLDLSLPEKPDIIVTDPPYYDGIAYPEFSDYYYVWYTKIFDLPSVPQWKTLGNRDISVEPSRRLYFASNIGSKEYFREKLSEAFSKLKDLVKDEGLIVTFYNHTKPEAWIALLYAGWLKAKLKVTAAHAVSTEARRRIKKVNATKSLDKSLVLVWRKEANGRKDINEVKEEALTFASNWLKEYILSSNEKLSIDLYFATFGKVLEKFTSYEELIGITKDYNGITILVKKYLFPTTSSAIIKALTEVSSTKELDPLSAFYVLSKTLLSPTSNEPRKIDSFVLTMFNVNSNISVKELIGHYIIQYAKLNKKSEKVLVEPYDSNLLNSKELWNSMPGIPEAKNGIFDNPVQLLHYLEYLIVFEYENFEKRIEKLYGLTRYIYDAIALAKILYTYLPSNDIEKELCKRILDII